MRIPLNTIRGAVAKKSMVPILTHVRVYQGRVQGGNGRYCIDSPCMGLYGFDFCCPADRFIKAVDACNGDPVIRLTEGGRVTLTQGKFRAILPTMPVAEYPLAVREAGARAIFDGSWLEPLKQLEPFIGEDASRPWAMGVWLADDGFMYTTNNVSAVRVAGPWSSFNEPIILPGYLVDELLRLGMEPLDVWYSQNSITFIFPDDVWLQGRLVEGQFPAQIKMMFTEETGGWPCDDIKAALDQVKPFCPDPHFPIIVMSATGISTAEGETFAHVEGLTLPNLKWHAGVLELVLAHAVELNLLVTPCAWKGANGVVGIALPLRD